MTTVDAAARVRRPRAVRPAGRCTASASATTKRVAARWTSSRRSTTRRSPHGSRDGVPRPVRRSTSCPTTPSTCCGCTARSSPSRSRSRCGAGPRARQRRVEHRRGVRTRDLTNARPQRARAGGQWCDSPGPSKERGQSIIRSSEPAGCRSTTRSRPSSTSSSGNAIFKRAWLKVGRVEQLPRNGSYSTKELKVANASVVVARTRTDRYTRSTTCAAIAATSSCGTAPRVKRPAGPPVSSRASITAGDTGNTARARSCINRTSSSTSTPRT